MLQQHEHTHDKMQAAEVWRARLDLRPILCRLYRLKAEPTLPPAFEHLSVRNPHPGTREACSPPLDNACANMKHADIQFCTLYYLP